jgi:hypothetical protein
VVAGRICATFAAVGHPPADDLTSAQASRLSSCAAVLGPRARAVVVGPAGTAAAGVLRAALPPDAELHVVAPHDARNGSAEAPEGPVDLLHITAGAGAATALADLERWGARVVPDGTLFVQGAFASIAQTVALARSVGPARGWRYAGRDGALAEYTRADLTPGERVIDGLAQAAQLPAMVRALARGTSASRKDRGLS